MSYHCVMTKEQKERAEAQGAEAQSLTPEMIKDKLKADLNLALMCLDSIYRDPAAFDMLADLMYGRYMNHQNAKAAAERLKEQKIVM